MDILPNHFERLPGESAARSLFKACVEQVEIETFTYCNRVCWFCPNAKIDRRSKNLYMDEKLYLRILGELASISYDKAITFSRYNEPLADPIILTRIRQARAALPSAFLFTHTNGDYLDGMTVSALRDAGLNALRVQVYLGANDGWDDGQILKRMVSRLAALGGVPYHFDDVRPGYAYSVKVEAQGIDVRFEAWNFSAMANDCGGLVPAPPYHRTAPCKMPFRHFYIDWNGSVVPCCNIRSDEPSHSGYVVDNLSSGRSILQAYADSPLVNWRKSLAEWGEKDKPCSTCSHAVEEDVRP